MRQVLREKQSAMTGPELDRLICHGRTGILTSDEQRLMADELAIFRAMTLRMERCIHELVKEAEAFQI